MSPEPQSTTLAAVVIAGIVVLVVIVILVITISRKGGNPQTNTPELENPAGSNAKFFIALSSDPIVISDESMHIVNYNESFRELVESEIILTNQSIDDLLRITDESGSEKTTQSIVHFGKGDIAQYDTLFVLNKANHKIEVQLSIYRVRTTTTTHLVWKFVNTSSLKQLQRQQSDFLSVISHELRTPVTVIEASTASLASNQDGLSPSHLKLINAARENTLLLSKLLADLSVYNVLQTGAINAELSSVSPRMILDQMQKVFTSQAEAKNIVLVVDHDQNVRNIISGESHILSILQNYISNAIHFSEPGGVVIIATKAVADGVIFMVRDTGAGMDQALQAKLFQNTFHAGTDTKHRTLQGAGVGLYISAQLAKSIGATVWAESQPQKGSTFYLKVPVSYETSENKTQVHGLEVVKFAQDV